MYVHMFAIGIETVMLAYYVQFSYSNLALDYLVLSVG